MKEFIDEAEIIRSDGRWRKLNEEITSYANKISVNESWKLDVFPNLAFNILNEYSRMKDGFDQQDNHSPIVVWHARNLLELSHWVLFCLHSEENERQLYEESGVDALDLLKQTKKAFAHDGSIQREYDDGIAKLKEETNKRGIQNIDRKFKNIREIAASFDLKQQFQFQNK